MMDKAWLWKKKATEKLPIVDDKVIDLSTGNEQEMEETLDEKAELENDLKPLSDKLASALSDCKNKDELVKKHSKMAQEAVHGWEKVEAEAGFLKQELDKSSQLRDAAEERIAQLDGALKECMQQLRHVRDEQEQRVHDAAMKTTREFEKSHMLLEEKLNETSKKLAKTGAENTHLTKALLVKEKLTEDLRRQLSQMEADLNALELRLESAEKENASLTYEVRVLEKELEIREEEREFNRRTADAAHQQHLDGGKKIAKLESECQRLRLLIRKRLPGPAALANMKNEVAMLGSDPVDMRRRSLSPNGLRYNSTADAPGKKINLLTEQLLAMEEENVILKEVLNKKMNELQFSKNMYNRAASKLSQVESAVGESPRGTRKPHEMSIASMSDIGSDDKASHAESWASALITELEHFRNEKQKGSPMRKTVGATDINLMDDFAEMEKLTGVSTREVTVGSYANNESSHIVEELHSDMAQENRKLKDDLVNSESANKELEGRLQSASDKNDALINQLKESEKIIATLQEETQSLRESKSVTEDQLKTQRTMNEDLDTQLNVARTELSEAHHKFSSLEDELENKNSCCEELEASCVDLQLQLESLKKSPGSVHNQEQRQGKTELEITAASEKLAECQETILNLGKQLKAIAAPREAALFDKVITDPANVNTTTIISTLSSSDKSISRRSSLLDQMLADNSITTKNSTSPKTKEVDDNSTSTTFGPKKVVKPLESILNLKVTRRDENAASGSHALVTTSKKQIGSLWRKIIWRKKKSSSKKAPSIVISS